MDPDTTLETDLADIRTLDALRKQVREMWKKGLKGLNSAKYADDRDRWVNPGDFVERAILVETLTDEVLLAEKVAPGTVWGFIKKSLRRIKCQQLFPDVKFEPPEPAPDPEDNVPVLRAACVLNALASTRGTLFTDGAFGSAFRIVYELKSASKAEELLGGAGAGGRGVPQTAVVTLWCVRAVQSFAKSFEVLGQLTRTIKNLTPAQPEGVPPVWWDIHSMTTRAVGSVTLAALEPRSPVPLGPLLEALQPEVSNPPEGTIVDVIDELSTQVQKGGKIASRLADLKPDLPAALATDQSDGPGLSLLAFQQAVKFMSELAQSLKGIVARFNAWSEAKKAGDQQEAGEELDEIAKTWDAIVKAVRAVLDPVKQYLRYVIDHELAAGTVYPQRIPDAAELLFAAEGLSRLGVDGPTLRPALERVLSLLSPEGRVPSHKPLDVLEKGYVLHVAGADVIRGLAELVRQTKYPIGSEAVGKLLRHFTDTWRDDANGWRHERDDSKGKCQWWLSGLCVQALGAIGRMLDARINQAVLGHFTVRPPEKLILELDALFYSDYGLVAADLRGQSVAVELQRLRAHVLGVKLAGGGERLHAVVLHGPPGTGKTTLVEALAKSASVPLVEVTPSDIVLAGMEKAEARARAVFEGLSMLTDAVILFDEFDSILWRRDVRSSRDGLLKFLTPGMLPKLKNLNESAKEQRVGFVLSTNFIGGLDDAAIREGRFNMRIGLYPPDALSRHGRLRTAVAPLLGSAAGASDEVDRRVREVVEKSAGLAMERLAKKGWFTPTDEPGGETPLGYVVTGKAPLSWPAPEKERPEAPEKDYSETLDGKTPNASAFQEWKEWSFVIALDDAYSNAINPMAVFESVKTHRAKLAAHFDTDQSSDNRPPPATLTEAKSSDKSVGKARPADDEPRSARWTEWTEKLSKLLTGGS